MRKIISINTETKQIEHTHFSGKHDDIFGLIDKKVDNLNCLRVNSPSGKQFYFFHDMNQDMYRYKNYVVFCGTMIWGNMVVASLTPDQSEFNNVTKEDFETLKPLFEFD